ncbi:MAG TPA: hypothetical protein VL360_00275 [Gammaproteobacteria bacterium]|nr:hypothetical protein [Gammaproteobacteria bacterium]
MKRSKKIYDFNELYDLAALAAQEGNQNTSTSTRHFLEELEEDLFHEEYALRLIRAGESEDAESESFDEKAYTLTTEQSQFKNSSELYSSDEKREVEGKYRKALFFTNHDISTSLNVKIPVRTKTTSELEDEKMGIDRNDIYIL